MLDKIRVSAKDVRTLATLVVSSRTAAWPTSRSHSRIVLSHEPVTSAVDDLWERSYSNSATQATGPS